MIVFKAMNGFGDALLQLGLLKMLHEQYNLNLGFIVQDDLQYEAIKSATFIHVAQISAPVAQVAIDCSGVRVIPFVADETARERNLSLIEMWAQSIPKEYPLKGEKKPFIQLTKADYQEAHKLKLQGKIFVSLFKVTCVDYPEIEQAQRYLLNTCNYKDYFLLGEEGRPKYEGFNCLYGLPIRIVGVLLQEAKALYCLNNGIANLAWAVGLKKIYEYVTPITEWGKIPYSERLN